MCMCVCVCACVCVCERCERGGSKPSHDTAPCCHIQHNVTPRRQRGTKPRTFVVHYTVVHTVGGQSLYRTAETRGRLDSLRRARFTLAGTRCVAWLAGRVTSCADHSLGLEKPRYHEHEHYQGGCPQGHFLRGAARRTGVRLPGGAGAAKRRHPPARLH